MKKELKEKFAYWAETLFYFGAMAFGFSILIGGLYAIYTIIKALFSQSMVLTYWLFIFTIYIFTLYKLTGLEILKDRYQMFFSKEYWINYNVIEFASWMAKAIIIIPGLIFGIELWYMHYITLLTSSLLIWASMKKSLPTLILFNTIWIGISLSILIKHYVQ